MAITPAVCNSFKVELGTATHNFTHTTGDTFKLCLLAVGATASKATTNYSDVSASEVGNSGTYSAGGLTLDSATPVLSSDTAVYDYADVSATGATIAAIGALIYNSSKSGKAVQALDFGGTKTSTAGTFAITFPAPAAGTAILGLG